MAVSLLSRQPRGPCPPPAPPSFPALFVRPQRRRRRRPPRVPWVGDRNQVKVAPSRSATVNRISGSRRPRGPFGGPPLAIPGSNRQVRKHRAQEPGGGRGLHVPLDRRCRRAWRQRSAAISSHTPGEPETIKVLRAPGQRQGDSEPGNAARWVRSHRQALPASPRHLAVRLGSARLCSAAPGSARSAPHALAPPRPWSGASRPRRALTRLGALRSSLWRTRVGSRQVEANRGGGGGRASSRPAPVGRRFYLGGRLPGTV